MKEITLTKGLTAKVDDEDYDHLRQWLWQASENGSLFYARRSIHVKHKPSIKVYMHRLIMNCTDRKLRVDHIDQNTLNNQKSNLRICTHVQNLVNQKKRGGASKYLGVSWHKRGKSWAAQAAGHYLGLFKIETEAAKAYNEKMKELFGAFATMNQV